MACPILVLVTTEPQTYPCDPIMKKALSPALLVAGLILLPAGANAQRRVSVNEGVRAELQKMAEAWNAANLAGHVAPYADSATMMGGRGPIVGRDTIEAALKPAETDYLYYVREPSRNDGAHNFYNNSADFERGVQALRNWERERDSRASSNANEQ